MLNPSIEKVIMPSGGNLVNYNYIDVANGTGMNIFYPAITNEHGKNITEWSSGAYTLSSTVIYSDFKVPVITSSNIGGAYVKIMDLDFDTVMNTPRTIYGNAIISVSHGCKVVTAGQTQLSYIQARLRKWDGTTETDLGVASGSIITVTGAAQDSHTNCLKIPIPEKVLIKKGETIRATIEFWAANAASGIVSYSGIGADPQARADDNANITIATTETTRTEVHIPFVLDL